MTEEEQEKLYELLFKDTKNKLETTIEKLRIANAELRDELDKKNSKIEKQQKEIEELKWNNDRRSRFDNETFANTIKRDYISKDKIREKINKYLEYDKKVKTYTYDGRENFTFEWYKARALEELLEE